MTHAADHGKAFEAEGFRFIPIPFHRGSMNPARECGSFVRWMHLYRQERPAIVHHIHMKPVLYGSWAARIAGVPAVVNTFAGLGTIFTTNGVRTQVLRAGVTAGLRMALTLPNSRALFENRGDLEQLVHEKVVRRERTATIGGAGVNITEFAPHPEQPGTPMILFASRMLWDKGVADFVQAARLLNGQKVPGRWVLVGSPDPDNPMSIEKSQLRAWQEEGVVEWWGRRDDMPSIVASAHVVVLPTFYGEGLPRILLEAGACARPVVATTIPGCQEIIRDGDNGYLVPPKDPDALGKAIRTLIEDPILRRSMGERGRHRVVSEFSTERVARQTLQVYEELLQHSSTGRGGTVRMDSGAACH